MEKVPDDEGIHSISSFCLSATSDRTDNPDDMVVLDGAATTHLNPFYHLFFLPTRPCRIPIEMGNGEVYTATEQGDVVEMFKLIFLKFPNVC